MKNIVLFMSNYKEVLIAVFSTTLGMVSTLITTHFLKALGDVKLNSKIIKLYYLKSATNELGDDVSEVVSNIKRADAIEFAFKLTFYNNSDMPKTLHSIQFQIIDDDNNEIFYTPKDKELDDYTNGRYKSFAVELIETAPKKVVIKQLSGRLNRGNGLNSLKGEYVQEIYINALHGNGKKYKRKIYDRKKVKN